MKVMPVVTMTTKTILLIHKKANMQEVVQACLTDLAGWNVQIAHLTSEGLRQARLYQPDAIILDGFFDEKDGLRFLQQLRREPTTQEIPVVLLIFRAKWFDLQQSWLQKYQVEVVTVNPLDPAMLPLQIANVLGWVDI